MANILLDQSQLDSLISAINARSKSNLLYEYVVLGSAVTSIIIPNLDILTHKKYFVEIDMINATATASILKLYVNSDITPANYASQSLHSNGATTTSASLSDAQVGVCDLSSQCNINANFSLSSSGSLRWSSHCSRGTATNSTNFSVTGFKKSTIANLTQFTFTASVALSIGIGSRIRIFRGDQ